MAIGTISGILTQEDTSPSLDVRSEPVVKREHSGIWRISNWSEGGGGGFRERSVGAWSPRHMHRKSVTSHSFPAGVNQRPSKPLPLVCRCNIENVNFTVCQSLMSERAQVPTRLSTSSNICVNVSCCHQLLPVVS